jgi:phage terminase Nu1 subunit (DNA packaging protein)
LQNYFNYFTEIEDHFQRGRGTILMLSTLDWALIETWKEAGIPIEAVLRGIDATFEKYNARPSKSRKVNGLAYCSQEVLAAAENMKEAAVGTSKETKADRGFDSAEIAEFLRRNAAGLESAKLPSRPGISPEAVAREISAALRHLAAEIASKASPSRLEDVERKLTVLEEKLFAALLAAVPDDEVVAVRAQADRDLAPYRSKMSATQIEQLQKQYAHKKLLEKYSLPRLSLFYM